jgi:hypothetical protein
MSISLQLPPAVDLFIKIENTGEIDALSTCFAANATVRDEDHTYEGLDAICPLLTQSGHLCRGYCPKGQFPLRTRRTKIKIPLMAVRGDRHEIERANFHGHGWM